MTDERLRQKNVLHLYTLYIIIYIILHAIYMQLHAYIPLHDITLHYNALHYVNIYIFTSLSIQFERLWGWAHGLQASRSIAAIAAIASMEFNRHNGEISRPFVDFVAVSQPWSPLGAIEKNCPTCNLHSCLFLRHVFTCSGFWIVSCLFSGSCRKTSWRWSTRARLTKWSRVTCIVSRWQSSRRGFEIILGLV